MTTYNMHVAILTFKKKGKENESPWFGFHVKLYVLAVVTILSAVKVIVQIYVLPGII